MRWPLQQTGTLKESVIVPSADIFGAANQRVENTEDVMECCEWYFCTKEITEEKIEEGSTWTETVTDHWGPKFLV